MKTDLAEMLHAKEQRFVYQQKLLGEYRCSLITFTLNIPGAVKQSAAFKELHNEGMRLLRSLFSVSELLFCASRHPDTGSEGYLCVNLDAPAVKRQAVTIEENHRLGRLFDIDVFNSLGNSVCRTTLGYAPRKCLVCGDEAKVCIRRSRHDAGEIHAAMTQLLQYHNPLNFGFFQN